jgi:hypothetical protein
MFTIAKVTMKHLGTSRKIKERREFVFPQLMEVNPYQKKADIKEKYLSKFRTSESTFWRDLRHVYELIAQLTIPKLNFKLNLAISACLREINLICGRWLLPSGYYQMEEQLYFVKLE